MDLPANSPNSPLALPVVLQLLGLSVLVSLELALATQVLQVQQMLLHFLEAGLQLSWE